MSGWDRGYQYCEKLKNESITELQIDNAVLTEKLDRFQGELETCRRERDEAKAKLDACYRDRGNARQQRNEAEAERDKLREKYILDKEIESETRGIVAERYKYKYKKLLTKWDALDEPTDIMVVEGAKQINKPLQLSVQRARNSFKAMIAKAKEIENGG